MKTFLKSLLPKLAQYSETLDKKTIFAGQSWVLIDEQNNKHQYIFENDGKLLLSINGKGREGSWKLIPNVNSLWIDNGEEKLLLNQGFIDNGIMVLKLDSFNNESAFILMNPKIVTDFNAEKYLKTALKIHLKKATSHEIPGSGEKDGDYEEVLVGKDYRLFWVFKNGEKVGYYHIREYSVGDKKISFKQSNIYMQIGDTVLNNKANISGKIEIKDNQANILNITVENNEVIKIKNPDFYFGLLMFIIFIVIPLIFFLIYSR